MTQPSSEAELGAALTRLLARLDPVPAAATAAASAAFEWRDLDAALAALTSDSQHDEPAVTVRGRPPRLLSFTTGAITIDIEVTAEDRAVRILGQLAPAQPAQIVVEYRGGVSRADADQRGRFAVAALPVGWLRVGVTAGAGDKSFTEWFKA
jgi:hypothetical protein